MTPAPESAPSLLRTQENNALERQIAVQDTLIQSLENDIEKYKQV